MADLLRVITILVTFCALGIQGIITDGECQDKTLVGQTYPNGSVWTAADNSCSICKCLNGEYTCTPKVCPSDDQLKCKKPIKVGFECCKRCSRKQRKRKTTKKCVKDITLRQRNRRRHRHGRRKGEGRRRGEKRRNTKRRQRRASDQEPAFYDKLCVDARTDHLVYRHIENKVMFMAFENIRTKMVDVWTWILKRKACDKDMATKLERCKKNGSGNIRLVNRTITTERSDIFRPRITKPMLFFSTTKRQVDKIKKNLNNSISKCDVKGSCRVKMIIRNFYHNKFRLFQPYYDCDRCD